MRLPRKLKKRNFGTMKRRSHSQAVWYEDFYGKLPRGWYEFAPTYNIELINDLKVLGVRVSVFIGQSGVFFQYPFKVFYFLF